MFVYARKIKLRENLISGIFYRWKYPDLRYINLLFHINVQCQVWNLPCGQTLPLNLWKVGDEIIRINGLILSESTHEEVVNIIRLKKTLTLTLRGMYVCIYRIAGKFGGKFKFGGLAVYVTTAKLKSTKISYSHIYTYVWRSRTEPPNLNPPIFLQ